MDLTAEQAVFSAFISPSRRRRYLSLLEMKRGREQLRSLLAHGGDLDERFIHRLPDSIYDPADVASLLHRHRAPKLCYVISELDDLDGKYLDLRATLTRIMEGGYGTFVSCLPGRLAFYQGELVDERFLLERNC